MLYYPRNSLFCRLTSIFEVQLCCRFITVRCYASAVLAIWACVCVCLSQVEVLLKRLNVGSHKQHHTIAQGL